MRESVELSLEQRAERLLREQQNGDGGETAEKRLAFLAEASLLLDRSLDFPATIARVARIALPRFADFCIVDLVDPQGAVHCVDSAHSVPHKDALLAGVRGQQPRPEGPRARVLKTGEPLLIAEVTEETLRSMARDEEHLRLLREGGPRSLLVVPLSAGGLTFGMLTFGISESARRFREADLSFARQLADRAAVAMDNARLHAEEQRARRIAEHTADRLARLQAVTAALSGAITPSEVGKVLLAEGASAFGAEAGTFMVLVDGGTMLELVQSFGLDGAIADRSRFLVADALPLGQAVRTRQPVLIDTPAEVSSCFPECERVARVRAGGLAAVPLQVDGRMLGAFQFCFPQGRHPRDIDRDFLLTLAGLSAQALDRARLFESAEASEERFRTLAELMPQQIWIHASGGRRRIEYFNSPALAYLGITLEEGSTLDEASFISRFMHPEDQPRVAAAWAKAHREGSQFEVEVRRRRADGVYRWHLNRAAPIRSEDGTVARWFGTATDIEDQKQTEAALRRSEGRFRRLTETAILGVGFFRVDGTVTEANDAALRITGYDRDDVTANRLNWRKLTPPEYRARDDEALAEMARTGFCTPYEKEYIRKDGSRVPILMGAALLEDSEEDGVGFIVDLTERKRIERAHAELLEREQVFRERLMGIVGHDLRNPLSAIFASIQLLERSGPYTPTESGAIDRISRSVNRMFRMVSQLLDFTRSRQGTGIAILREPLDLSVLCREVLDELIPAYPGRTLGLETSGDARGEWDHDRLAQVVSNLAANALQHGDLGLVRVRVVGESDSVCLEVHNGGEPIPEADLPYLFDPYRAGRQPRSAPSDNLGLGLYIVQQIVLGHGGTIEVRSTATEGTTFTVRLPRRAHVKG